MLVAAGDAGAAADANNGDVTCPRMKFANEIAPSTSGALPDIGMSSLGVTPAIESKGKTTLAISAVTATFISGAPVVEEVTTTSTCAPPAAVVATDL